MKLIPLTHEKFAMVDDEDFYKLIGHKWYYFKDKFDREFAIRGTRKTFYMHRDIMGVTDPTVKVDHISGDCLDNRRSNLRLATNQQNCSNQRISKGNTSGYKGVTWHKGHKKWYAQIGYKFGKICIGDFDTPEEAAHAYDAKAIELFGEFARTNFPRSEY